MNTSAPLLMLLLVSTVDAVVEPASEAEPKRLWQLQFKAYCYATPVVSGDLVIVGGGLGLLGDQSKACVPKVSSGAVVAIDTMTGARRWQLPTVGLATQEWWFGTYGVCSTPAVVGEQIFVIGSSGDVLCLDRAGLANGNQGATDELAYIRLSQPDRAALEPTDADILWRYDMSVIHRIPMHDAVAGSPLIIGDQVWIPTSPAIGRKWREGHHPTVVVGPKAIPKYTAVPDWPVPNLIVLDRATGKLLATDDIAVEYINHGQWSSPVLVTTAAGPLVVLGDGNSVLHAFAPPSLAKDPQILKRAWSRDIHVYRHDESGQERVKSKKLSKEWRDNAIVHPYIIGRPAVAGNRLVATLGHDNFEIKAFRGAAVCVDTRTGDMLWTATEDVATNMNGPIIVDDVVYIADDGGGLHALALSDGTRMWRHDLGESAHTATPVMHGDLMALPTKKKFHMLKIAANGPAKVTSSVFDAVRVAEAPSVAWAGNLLIVPSRDSLTAFSFPTD